MAELIQMKRASGTGVESDEATLSFLVGKLRTAELIGCLPADISDESRNIIGAKLETLLQ